MRDQELGKIHTLVIHNTETGERDEAGLQKVIREHIQERKWSDVGYHFLIAHDSRDGHWKVLQGRPMEKIGAHARTLEFPPEVDEQAWIRSSMVPIVGPTFWFRSAS